MENSEDVEDVVETTKAAEPVEDSQETEAPVNVSGVAQDDVSETGSENEFNTEGKKPRDNAADVGTILIVLFSCAVLSAACVLLANKFYQQYQKRKLYDKLDYLSNEPLYANGGSSYDD